MASQDSASTAVVSVRRGPEDIADASWSSVPVDALAHAVPWRTFRWHAGQMHFSGAYWAATSQNHVIYESRLELGRLLFADFDPRVRAIVAQPFLLSAVVDGRPRRHVPDFLLLSDTGPVVVDVKPAARLAKPKVAFTLDWTRQLVESRGWGFEVSSEPVPVVLENVRFLAGYRRGHVFDPGLLAELRWSVPFGATLGQAFAALPSAPAPLVRAAVLHLLWTRHFEVDLDRPLSERHVLLRGPA